MAASDARASRLMKPPGILPAAYIRSSNSTVSGKKSRPGRGSDRLAVPEHQGVAVADGDGAAGEARELAGLDGQRATTELRLEDLRQGNGSSLVAEEGDDLRQVGRLGRWAPDATRTPVCAGVRMRRRLAAESEPSDDGAVARVVLLHQVREKAAALADELEEAAARMIVLGEALEMAVSPLIRSVRSATWTSGEPVSPSLVANPVMISCFSSRASGTRSSEHDVVT